MSKVSHNDIAKAIYFSLKENDGQNINTKIINFLVRKKLFSKHKSIIRKVEKIKNKEEGEISASVSSVEKLNQNLKETIILFLSKKYNTDKIFLKEKIDKKLKAGFKIKVDDEVLDLTIFSKLKKLEEYLIR